MNQALSVYIILMLCCNLNIFSQQEEMLGGELIIKFVNPPSTYELTVKIESVGTVWNRYHNITTGYPGGTIVYNDTGREYHASDFEWDNQGYLPLLSLGLYKISIWEEEQEKVWCYIDYRTSVLPTAAGPTCIDLLFEYDVINDSWIMTSPSRNNINGKYFTIWELKEYDHATEDFEDYWEHALSVIPQLNTSTQVYEPFLCWGPFNDFLPESYKIYWREGQSGSFSLLDDVSAESSTYQHYGLAVGDGLICEYKIRAYDNPTYSDYSNIAGIGTNGFYKMMTKATQRQKSTNLFSQNFPNPFNPSTTIIWKSLADGHVLLRIFDALGREVACLVDEFKAAGTYSVQLNAEKLSSGIYFYTLRMGDVTVTKSTVLQR